MGRRAGGEEGRMMRLQAELGRIWHAERAGGNP